MPEAGEERKLDGLVDLHLCLRQLGLGLLDAVAVALHILAHPPDRVGERRGVALDQAAQDVVIEAVVIEGVIDGAAHVQVIERGPRDIELRHHDAHGLGFDTARCRWP